MSDMPLRVVEAAVSQLGSPYVFGAWGEFCTPAGRRRRKRADHPTIVSACQVLSNKKDSCDGCKWQGDRMFDCRGFVYWCLKQVDITLTGQGATSQYNTSANWVEKGNIADMPECVCAVFIADGNKKSHTGLYIGGGETIECSAGVQRKALSKRWTHYAIPKGLYTAEEIAQIRATVQRPDRTLSKGDTGEDVRDLQIRLNDAGYDCGTADGIFGKKTLAAVKAFQQDIGLTPDGIVGANTWKALKEEETVAPIYTLRIPNLTKAQADELKAQFPDAVFVY